MAQTRPAAHEDLLHRQLVLSRQQQVTSLMDRDAPQPCAAEAKGKRFRQEMAPQATEAGRIHGEGRQGPTRRSGNQPRGEPQHGAHHRHHTHACDGNPGPQGRG